MTASIDLGWQLREAYWLNVSLLLVLICLVRYRRREGVTLSAGDILQDGEVPFPVTMRQRLAGLPWLLELSGALLLVVALARPVVVEVDPPARLGRDVMLCFDRSSSMATLDVSPDSTRLAVARELAGEFLAARADDRIGIVTFARYADLVCPVTADHNAVKELLGTVKLVAADGAEDATAIGAAVGMAANLLQHSVLTGKVIVLLTDGEENVAMVGATDEIAPLHAGQWCRDHGIRVHTIALGRGDQLADGSYQALDTTAVQQLAKLTGGRFYPAANAEALRSVYAEIDQLEAVEFQEPLVRVVEHYALPTWLGLLLLFLSHWLRNSRMGAV